MEELPDLTPFDVQTRDDGLYVFRGPAGSAPVLLDATELQLLRALQAGKRPAELVYELHQQKAPAPFSVLSTLLRKLRAAAPSAARHADRGRLPACMPPAGLPFVLALVLAMVGALGGSDAFAAPILFDNGSPLHAVCWAWLLLVVGFSLEALLTAATLGSSVHFSWRGGLLRLQADDAGLIALSRRPRRALLLLRWLAPLVPAALAALVAVPWTRDAAFLATAGWLLACPPLLGTPAGHCLNEWLEVEAADRQLRLRAAMLLAAVRGSAFLLRQGGSRRGLEAHEETVILGVLSAVFAWTLALLNVTSVVAERLPLPDALSVWALLAPLLLWTLALGVVAGVALQLLLIAWNAVATLAPASGPRLRRVRASRHNEVLEVLRDTPVLAGTDEYELRHLVVTGRLVAFGAHRPARWDAHLVGIVLGGEIRTADGRILHQGEVLAPPVEPLRLHVIRHATLLALAQGTWSAWQARQGHGEDMLERVTELTRLLAANALFRGLSARCVHLLAGVMRPSSHAAGENVMVEGEPGTCLYLVAAGTLEVVRAGAVIASLQSGDICGEMALLRDAPRSATVRTTSECRLLALDADDFWRIAAEDVDFGTAMEWLAEWRAPA